MTISPQLITDAHLALLDWLMENWPGVSQAMTRVADSNDAKAKELDTLAPAVAQVCRESAASWRKTSDTLLTLIRALPDDEDED